MSLNNRINSKQRIGVSSGNITIDDWDGDIVAFALSNNFEGVDKILKLEPEMINAQRIDSGVSALMAASGRGLHRMVDHLLAKEGVDLYLKDNAGRDAFDHAILFPQVVERLMRARHPGSYSGPDLTPI